MNTIYILWLRQIKRFYRSKARMVGSFGQPLLFLVALGFGFGPIFKQAGQGNYIQFLTPGIISMTILFTGLFSGIEIIWDKKFGFLKETLVAPVPRMNIMIGRTLGGATVAVIQGLIILFLSLLFGFKPAFAMLPIGIIFMLLIALFFTAIGTSIASKLEDMQGFQLIMNFIVMPIFFLSGALFPLNNIPTFLEIIVKVNPLAYGVDGLRAAFTNTAHFGMQIDFIILTVITLMLLLIGSYFFKRIEI